MAAAAKSLQSCPTLCDPRDGSPPGSPIPGILQARTLKWVAVSFSNVWKWKVIVKMLSLVRLLATPWTAAFQAPPSMGFSRQEYWSGLPLPSLLASWANWKKKKDREHVALVRLMVSVLTWVHVNVKAGALFYQSRDHPHSILIPHSNGCLGLGS